MEKIYKLSILSAAILFLAFIFGYFNLIRAVPGEAVDLRLDDQEATIRSIKKVMPAVVSIVIFDKADVRALDPNTGEITIRNERVQKGSGTGVLITADGLILTNKHVVNAGNPKTAEYRIILSTGKEYYAQFIGQDPLNDLAVLKIFDKKLPFVELGDSSALQLGSTVIAIGNTLGRYQNSVTKGIISGIERSIEASDQDGNGEVLDNVLQTDAEINPGNSGGPLADLNGRIVGINVAIDQEGSSIGFAIPINDAKKVIQTVKESGRIIRPRLGVRYIMITPAIAEANKLSRDSGAWIYQDENTGVAVMPDSPAAKAGIQADDIIFEINGKKIQGKDTLLSLAQAYKPGDRIKLKLLRGKDILTVEVTLDEFKN